MSAQDPNKRFYFTKVSPDKVKDICSEIMKDLQTISLWESGKEDKAEEFEILEFNEQTKTFKLKSKGGLLSKLTGSKLSGKEVMIKVPFGKFFMFTTSKLEHCSNTDYYSICLTGDVFKSQQRDSYRLSASEYTTIKFRIDETTFDAEDVSAGGTCLIIDSKEKARFPKGKEFRRCKVQINEEVFDIPKAKIAATWDVKDQAGTIKEIGLGIQFCDMPMTLDEKLYKHINTEARGEEIRRTILKKK